MTQNPAPDMVTLARLHAALDSVVETEQLLAAISDHTTAALPTAANAARVAKLVGEAREILRAMLARPSR